MEKEVLLYTKDTQHAKDEIASIGGQVSQQLSDTLIIATVPDAATPENLKTCTTSIPEKLDPVEELAVAAFKKRQQDKLIGKAPSPKEGLSWDTPGYSSPRKRQPSVDSDTDGLAEIAESTGTPTSLYMAGSISVGIFIVSGNRPELVFSQQEQQKVVEEVQEGLSFLAQAEPRARITFVQDIRLVTVTVAPGPTDNYETAEAPWRNAALSKIGFSGSRQGSIDYVQALKAGKRTDWAYVAYFTKYPLHHFAYAVEEKLCMEFSNDGWGIDVINRVFAHETCHIFGAADEYGNCRCGGSHGHFGVPNNNCVNCPGPRVQCLMDANTLEICQWSRGQIGWNEQVFQSLQDADHANIV